MTTCPAVTPTDDAPERLRSRARLALARRDLLEFVRDRRTLFVTLLLPMAMYPILALSSALGVRTAISDIDARQAPTDLRIVLSGRPRDAQAFAKRLESLRPDAAAARRDWPAALLFAYVPEADAAEAVETGAADLWIDVPEAAVAAIDGAGTLALEAHGPTTRPLAPRVREQFNAVMLDVAADARRRRIDAAGLPESLLSPVQLRFSGKADAPGTVAASTILPTAAGGVFVLLSVLTMTGAFYPAIDAIAGEKERGTIETLLIAPCAAIDIVGGKFLAVWAVALATLVANVISIALTAAVSLRFLPKGGPLLPGGSLPLVVFISLAAFVGLSAVAAAMCLAVTTASKSGKEAQNTLTPVLLIASALAGAGLLADPATNPLLPAVPFAGQVAIARATLQPDERPEHAAAVPADWRDAAGPVTRLAVPLAVSLVSSAVIVWLLLRGTAALLTDEEILFRGPDMAGGTFARPARRRRPTVTQGIMALVIGLAGLWYSQGIAPDDARLAIPVYQAAAVGLPLVLLLAWQRVDVVRTFGLRWPARPAGRGWWPGAATIVGATLVGCGLFVVGAAAMLAIRGTDVSPEAKELADKLVAMMRETPPWLAWTLIALVPAVCEETLFRGWVQSALVGGWPSRGRMLAGLLVQAACFAVFHLLPERMPQSFALGLAAGAIALATRSLLPAIVCHAAHNSMPLVLLWLTGMLSPASDVDASVAAAAGTTLPTWIVMAGAATLAVGAVILRAAVAAGNGRRPHGAGFGGNMIAAFLVVAAIAVGCRGTALAEDAAGPPPRLRVAVMPLASAVEWSGEQPTGLMIDLWDELARRLGVASEFTKVPTFRELMQTLPDGTADVALGPIAITAERERIMDLTHPIAHSGLRIAVRREGDGGLLPAVTSLVSWQLLRLLGLVLALAIASGHLLWWFERPDNPQSFPPEYPRGVIEAIWWIASTVVAGGCDNKHVASGLGRTIAFAWMVGGIVLLAAFTSVLTAALTAEQVRGSIHGPKDLARRVVGCQESAVSVPVVRSRGGIPREFARLDDAFAELAAGEIDAVVGENNQMMSLTGRPDRATLELVGPIFESFDYGIGLATGSPLRERCNTEILGMHEDGTTDRIFEKWLGRHD
jgi:polar amino acid transport system substrate-binding protein